MIRKLKVYVFQIFLQIEAQANGCFIYSYLGVQAVPYSAYIIYTYISSMYKSIFSSIVFYADINKCHNENIDVLVS